jgi:hypothetical protein
MASLPGCSVVNCCSVAAVRAETITRAPLLVQPVRGGAADAGGGADQPHGAAGPVVMRGFRDILGFFTSCRRPA